MSAVDRKFYNGKNMAIFLAFSSIDVFLLRLPWLFSIQYTPRQHIRSLIEEIYPSRRFTSFLLDDVSPHAIWERERERECVIAQRGKFIIQWRKIWVEGAKATTVKLDFPIVCRFFHYFILFLFTLFFPPFPFFTKPSGITQACARVHVRKCPCDTCIERTVTRPTHARCQLVCFKLKSRHSSSHVEPRACIAAARENT